MLPVSWVWWPFCEGTIINGGKEKKKHGHARPPFMPRLSLTNDDLFIFFFNFLAWISGVV